MADEKKETVEETAAEEKTEKKENAFSRFWKNTKQSVNDQILEGKIRSAYENAHPEFTIYTRNETFSKRASGKLEGDTLTIFGEEEIKPAAVVLAHDEKETAYYVVKTEKTTVTSQVEGVTYERPGTVITLDANVEEVKVVKAGKRYFIYKGNDEE